MYLESKEWSVITLLEERYPQEARDVFKAMVERTFLRMRLPVDIFNQYTWKIPSAEVIKQLEQYDHLMSMALEKKRKKEAFSDFITYLNYLADVLPVNSQDILSTILAEMTSPKSTPAHIIKSRKLIKNKEVAAASEFLTTAQVAKKLGLTDQTIRRMCESGKIQGQRTEGGHWRIPKHLFVTTDEQDEITETVLKRLDRTVAEKAGVVQDEYDLS
ncbi:excisionase family DNA-binding protein [Paenibacillus rhizovicinus]|uniref:Excisionase family DNA-binding protein n=1 Tax=Paenibacillus rhizovicinus TaxID=2704463 RepID=A0A6C0P5E2_9BACL|nr:helix-turn-helix domain-containing protein [Paenibacillus rhizovicinus]QHW31852.1 excisionase family DNA-binding protein [Paenibacillus rhizovicinus]